MEYAEVTKNLIKHMKAAIRYCVYSKTMLDVSGYFASWTYKLATLLNKRHLWCLFLVFEKIQVAIGYRSGEFSYLKDHIYAKRLMRKIDQRVIDATSRIKKDPVSCNMEQSLLFVTSFIARTGGHTRLLQSYLAKLSDAKLLISGDAFFAGRQKFLREQKLLTADLFKNADDRVVFNHKSCLLPCKQVDLLYRHLVILRPKSIILLNEPSDISLLLAVLIYIKCNDSSSAYYYHHADDFFPLLGDQFQGHIDIDSNQDVKCKCIANRTLIRIASKHRRIVSSLDLPFTLFSFVPLKKIITKGDENGGYVDLVASLSKEGIKIIIATRKGEKNDLITCLKLRGANISLIDVDEECFDIEKYAGCFHVYLDTFPIGGGMSIVDALSLRRPIVINAYVGYGVFRDSILSAFMVANTDEVFERIKKLREDHLFYDQHSKHAYEIYLKYFETSSMVRTFRDFIDN